VIKLAGYGTPAKLHQPLGAHPLEPSSTSYIHLPVYRKST